MDAPGLADVARELADLLSRAPDERPQVRALAAPGAGPARVAAIDGSSVVLAESGSHVVGAYRAARVLVERGAPRLDPARSPRVCLLAARDEGALEALRTAEELALARDAIEQLARGDLLLLDGALRASGELDALLARAAERRVDVVGVCKSTSLTVGNAPAIAACQLAARAECVGHAWHAELRAPPHVRGRVLVARLSRAEERPFRFDIASGDPADEPAAVLSRVAALAGHPGYPGYPSPLAMAHHQAVITEDERRRLAMDVMERVAALGVSGDAWRAAFLDYHDVLELGV